MFCNNESRNKLPCNNKNSEFSENEKMRPLANILVISHGVIGKV